MSPPPTTSSRSRQAQGVFAAAVRLHGSDDPRTRAARTNWRGESYLAAVDAAVRNAPPLSADQRDRLSVLLRPACTAAGLDVAADRKAVPA